MDIVINEYLEEMTAESADIPEEASDIVDWVFGTEEQDDEEAFCEKEQLSYWNRLICIFARKETRVSDWILW